MYIGPPLKSQLKDWRHGTPDFHKGSCLTTMSWKVMQQDLSCQTISTNYGMFPSHVGIDIVCLLSVHFLFVLTTTCR